MMQLSRDRPQFCIPPLILLSRSSSSYVSHILHSHARDNAIEIEFYLSDDMEMNLSHKRTCVCMRLTTFKSFPLSGT